MNIRSLRPKYAISRMRQISFCKKYPATPWLTASAIHLLDSWLRPTDVGLEWGSGRSTIWFAGKVGRLTSIEDSREWFDQVTKRLAEKGIAGKVDYRFVACPHQEVDEPETAEYASTAESLPDNSVDFALVDGNIRVTCMPIAMRKVKPGGLLILDNSNRYLSTASIGGQSTVHEPRTEPRSAKWAGIEKSLASWRAILTTDNIWNTRFWVKPIG